MMRQFINRLQLHYDRLNSRWLELRRAHLVSRQDAKRPVTAQQLNLEYCRRQIDKGAGLYWPAWAEYLAAETAADPELTQALITQLKRQAQEVKRSQRRLATIPEPPAHVVMAWVNYLRRLPAGQFSQEII